MAALKKQTAVVINIIKGKFLTKYKIVNLSKIKSIKD